MRSAFITHTILCLLIVVPFISVSAQDTAEDPYADYSHLWEDTDKKKKEKKKKPKKNEAADLAASATDSLNLTATDSLDVQPDPEVIQEAEDVTEEIEDEEETKPEKKERLKMMVRE